MILRKRLESLLIMAHYAKMITILTAESTTYPKSQRIKSCAYKINAKPGPEIQPHYQNVLDK